MREKILEKIWHKPTTIAEMLREYALYLSVIICLYGVAIGLMAMWSLSNRASTEITIPTVYIWTGIFLVTIYTMAVMSIFIYFAKIFSQNTQSLKKVERDIPIYVKIPLVVPLAIYTLYMLLFLGVGFVDYNSSVFAMSLFFVIGVCYALWNIIRREKHEKHPKCYRP